MRGKKAARRLRVPLGLLFTVSFLLLAQPTWRSLLAGLPLVLGGLWLRGCAAGTLRKFQTLVTTGPYAHTRNPLYLGSLLLAAGFALAGARWWIAVVLATAFGAIYTPTILSEEESLRGRYSGFEEYTCAVPRFIPRLVSAYPEEGRTFSWAVYAKNREYQALIGAVAMYAALGARILFEK